ncbi:hypothetical protein [Clostridium senegalense]|uniref:Uncharacterized protein n=1 Tax=Clostridium senegalense TaxID=1465809 RepID=A0A6M0H4G9_9CLOT|nr:hypothetical protein [Clostridium senegalense]NEU05178.1 hypothetical protein [Clostridium senegalense]
MSDWGEISVNNTKQLKEDGLKKRIFNINAFAGIDRNGLEFRNIERQLLLYTTQQGEKIYIQYPGKETKTNDINRIRPWDFRPKLKLNNGCYIKDLSFADIWDDLYGIKELQKETLAILVTVFFRMAFMIDTEPVCSECCFMDMNLLNQVEAGRGIQRLKWYSYKPNTELMKYLNQTIGKIRGASIEAYLYYNDLLVQNEDCKYFYKDTHINEKKWNTKAGRYNTLMTHISVIEFLQGNMKFSQIMNKFQRGRGVAPVTQKSLYKASNGLITK